MVLMLVAGAPAPVRAQAQTARSARAALADSVRAAGPARIAWRDQPRMVMMRSLLIPGWGQFHNRAYFKALGVAGAEAALVVGVQSDRRELDRLNAEVLAGQAANDADRVLQATNAYNVRLDRYVSRQWWLAGVVVYALLDAYVDAHFRNFDIEFRNDPALPGAPAPGKLRLDLRWNF